MAAIENIHSPICTQPIPSSWQNGLHPALATSLQRGDYIYLKYKVATQTIIAGVTEGWRLPLIVLPGKKKTK